MNPLGAITGALGGMMGGGSGVNLGAFQQQMNQDLNTQMQMNQLTEHESMLSNVQKAAHDAIMTMTNNAH